MSTTAPEPQPPQPQLGQEPAFDAGFQHGTMPRDLQFKTEEGMRASNAQQMQQMRDQGYMKCPDPKCWFMISPQALNGIKQSNGYFTCPACHHSYDLMEELPWHGAPEENFNYDNFSAGGGTRIGLSLQDQSQIGEDLVEHLGEIPGYGKITWWHPGGSISQSPLDGATKDWGIEVKTLGMDAKNHRFVPGRTSEKTDKNNMATEMGLKGVLGILVMLDYRRSVADIYAKEMPTTPWQTSKGQMVQGVAAFRKNSAQKLIAEVPFKNPFMDPSNPSPTGYTEGSTEPENEMPF